MFTNKKREGINRFVCDVSLCVAEIPKVSIKDHEPLLPIIPFGIVAYGFVGQPFSKQLYVFDCQCVRQVKTFLGTIHKVYKVLFLRLTWGPVNIYRLDEGLGGGLGRRIFD